MYRSIYGMETVRAIIFFAAQQEYIRESGENMSKITNIRLRLGGIRFIFTMFLLVHRHVTKENS